VLIIPSFIADRNGYEAQLLCVRSPSALTSRA
jgi:hypothetical protein